MGQSLVRNYVHLIYSTKHRQRWLLPGLRDVLFAYQAGIFQHWESPAIIIGGIEVHVHTLFSLSKNHALRKVVEEVKKDSSRWMKTQPSNFSQTFYWQSGYAGFSVSQSNVEEVRNYVADQEHHHQKFSFQDELRRLFQRYQINFDEKYVWD